MTNGQAVEIVQHCFRVDPTVWRCLYYPESRFPPGGFPVIVEAIARYCVTNPFKQDPLALQAWAELGVTTLAATVSDQLFALCEARIVEHATVDDSGARQAMFLADSIARAITERQSTEGSSMLQRRVVELGGQWLNTSGVAVERDAKGTLAAVRRGDTGGLPC
jgi:hypothetical protein